MIQVIVKKKDENITGFHMEGHSGYAEYGLDIICSAVSALTVNCVNSIEEFTSDKFLLDSDEKTGRMDFQLTGESSEESQLLLHSLIPGLKGISEAYGSQYVKLINC